MSKLKCLCQKDCLLDTLDDNSEILICQDRKCNYIYYVESTNILDMKYNSEDSENDEDYSGNDVTSSDDEIESDMDIDYDELILLQEDANDFLSS